MADITGFNDTSSFAILQDTLVFDDFAAGSGRTTSISIRDSSSIVSSFSRFGVPAGNDPVDYFSFQHSGLDSVTLTFDAPDTGNYANLLMVIPSSGVASASGAVVATWFGGIHNGGNSDFGGVIVGIGREYRDAIANGQLPSPADLSDTRLVEDTSGPVSVTWDLTGRPVTFEVYAVGFDRDFDGNQFGTTTLQDLDYEIEITPLARSFAETGDGGILFQNSRSFAETHTGSNAIDVYFVNASRSSVSVTVQNDASLVVETLGLPNRGDTLIDIERIQLSDGFLAFDTEGNAGQIYRLYQAAFDRDPDVAGLGHWIDTFDRGLFDLTGVAQEFLISDEFQQRFGTDETLNDSAYLTLLYNNVLDRDPDQAGFDFWSDQQAQGLSRADMLQYFSESPENFDNVSADIDAGIFYL